MRGDNIGMSARPDIDTREWGLILFSHGSLLCGSGAALDAHVDRLRAAGEFAAVETGYLNYSEPEFETAVGRIASAGIRRIVVSPYFLVPGYFVTSSLPARLAQAERDFPGMRFVIASCLGVDELLVDALIELARRPRGRERWRDSAQVDPLSCRHVDGCPVRASAGCPEPRVAERPGGAAPLDLETPPFQCDALALLVHGSPRADANLEALSVARLLQERGHFPVVETGFLECASPSIEGAVARCIDRGARRITAVPHFLHTGAHVAIDLPDALDAASAKYPGAQLRLANYLGASAIVTRLLAQRVREALRREMGKTMRAIA